MFLCRVVSLNISREFLIISNIVIQRVGRRIILLRYGKIYMQAKKTKNNVGYKIFDGYKTFQYWLVSNTGCIDYPLFYILPNGDLICRR